ncbi:uncharacterized protein NECHADRAFT_84216 [Fusarium vanettenii 77-13-4]|uniref:CorA-like transporter domain-containing protein n=1 Tax=Fusarium vanettenii (strain ATCC MYA-4622 / CBS 123669 / FGSC 9596 / NRRL 45880 / 77-13-4) TaxID=660122 RepID=C7Z015_FUSV7|nr:uncharacterized protein NECHADRAFT_84216 [Fusarium vanettenii 77-13-4]EEU42891.1 hypothetical protein NECHADRAFT_84216 [Fusarium vanettenii 77-13-4]
MAYLFTYHQVMARFLDFWCSFKFRETSHSFTHFQNEDYLGSQHHQPGLIPMGRSGIRIQHCFNILGIERSRDNKGWELRQTAAYHSYDLIEGRALWVVLKGDNTMRRRLETTTEESIKKGDAPLQSVHASFAQTLTDHLLIMQWCVENWESYAEGLERKYASLSGVADHAPVDDLADDIAIIKQHEKVDITPGSPLKQQTSGLEKSPESPGFARRLSMKVTGLSTVTQVEPPPRKVEHVRMEGLVQFDELQSLSSLAKSLGEAVSAITQNRRVLAQIREYYRELVNSEGFKRHVPKSTMKLCKQAASEFAMKIGRLEDDLANYEGNLKTILHGVERTETMYNGILQYQSMRTAKYFAESSEKSTEIMKGWTQEMHEKTMSMHVITVFTLIFLPGTFVATIFSSGIISFGQDGGPGFGSAMGAWKVRLAALKLFASVLYISQGPVTY